jgi:CheY-like chemotaxis protein
LCVDDDKLVLNSLRIQLLRHYQNKHHTEFAQDATEAFEVIEELIKIGVETVLVISDWIMPGMNGDEFLAKVNVRYPHMRTMMLTGQVSGEKSDIFLKSGITSVIISKPWTETELISSIQKLLAE